MLWLGFHRYILYRTEATSSKQELPSSNKQAGMILWLLHCRISTREKRQRKSLEKELARKSSSAGHIFEKAKSSLFLMDSSDTSISRSVMERNSLRLLMVPPNLPSMREVQIKLRRTIATGL